MADFDPMIPVTIREYARMNQCSDTTIHKKIKNGTLSGNALQVNLDNDRPLIIPFYADEQWGAHYREQNNIVLVTDQVKKQVIPLNATMAVNGQEPGSAAEPGMVMMADPGHQEPGPQVNGNGKPQDPRMSYTEADRLGKVMDYEMKKLKLQQMQGDLVEKEKVFHVLFEFGNEIKSAMTAIPDRTIDDILAAPSRNDAHHILFVAISEALETLANMETLEIK